MIENSELKSFTDKDNNLNIDYIQNKKICIFGYGSQAHAHALNLKDSGCTNITIILRKTSQSWKVAEEDGFIVQEASEAVEGADILMFLVPDENQKALYESIESKIPQNACLAFAHGFNIHYNHITPRADLDVIMIAPKGPGHTVRYEYRKGAGVPTLIAIQKDSSGNAKDIALAWASGIGGGRARIYETSFKNETETDLFGEQTILCGGLEILMRASFETLTEAGYPAEMAYYETVHELKLIVDMIYEGGLEKMNFSISNTAEYGSYKSGEKIYDKNLLKENLRGILKDIQNGEFAKDFIKNSSRNLPNLRKEREETPIIQTGKNIRKDMSWLQK